MRIRNGFLREEEGGWTNLKMFRTFCVERLVDGRYAVFGYTDTIHGQVSRVYDLEDDAQCALDDAFGYDA